jgi:hypothetical protein
MCQVVKCKALWWVPCGSRAAEGMRLHGKRACEEAGPTLEGLSLHDPHPAGAVYPETQVLGRSWWWVEFSSEGHKPGHRETGSWQRRSVFQKFPC